MIVNSQVPCFRMETLHVLPLAIEYENTLVDHGELSGFEERRRQQNINVGMKGYPGHSCEILF